MIGLGQVVGLLGPVIHHNGFADAYSIVRYFLLSILCLTVALTQIPKRGILSAVGLVYMLVLLAVSLWSFQPVSFVGNKLSFFTGFLPMCLVACVYHYSIGEDYEKIVSAFVTGCTIAALIALAQNWRIYLPQGDYFGGGRVYACMGNPVFLSGLMAMAVPLCLGSRYRPFAIPLLFNCILLTQSRSGLIAACIGMLGYAFARGVIGRKLFTLLACLSVLAFAGMFSGLRNTAKSDLGRYHMARLAVKSILDHPLGVGPERFHWVIKTYRDEAMVKDLGPTWTNAYVHNSLLEALVSGGIPLLLAHCLLMGAIGAFLLRYGTPQLFGSGMALAAYSLTQPCPLILKAIYAALLASLSPSWASGKPMDRRLFVIASAAALYASLGALAMARVWHNGNRFGLGEMIERSYTYSPSARTDE